LSFLLDLRGPSASIDTACSSSLVAIHLACQSLRFGECRTALAGGVTLHLTPEHYVAMAKLGMLSPDGRCKTFDAGANGFVPGEGCGIIVLKRLADALADGDRIHAIIRGTATTQDGRTSVLTAPNGLAQQAVMRAALDNARVAPEQITYVEAHGTGTALGDPIEVEALAAVLDADGSTTTGATVPCVLGAVKTNFGHLEAAAGVAGVIKAILALEHEQIPPNLHFAELNPLISLEGTRLQIPTALRAWPRGVAGRFAGVSSFGFGGTNAHVVLEEAPVLPAAVVADETPENSEAPAYVLPISARDTSALVEFARTYERFLSTTESIGAVCRAAAVRRSHYEERVAVTGTTVDELRSGLRDILAGQTRLGASVGRATDMHGVVFVCSGQGSQWARMGVELMHDYPVFRDAIDECDRLIQQHAGWSLRAQLETTADVSQLEHTQYTQPAIVAIEIALARLWESWGIAPAAVVGHSVGEIAAAHIAGALTLDEAMRIVVHRGRLMERATGTGRMAAVFLPPDAVEHDIAEFGDILSVAAVNGPQSVVVSGDPAAIDTVMARWNERGVGCKALPVDYAFHSAQMEPFSDELTRALGTVATRKTRIPMISTVTGCVVSGSELTADYWGRNVRQPVLFEAGIAQALSTGFDTFVEVGPHPVLTVSVQECIAARRLEQAVPEQSTQTLPNTHRSNGDGVEIVLPSLRRNQHGRTTLFASLGALYTRGAPIDWRAVYRGAVGVVPLPTYPYQRQHYWVTRASRPGWASGALRRPLLDRQIRSPLLSGTGYEVELSLAAFPFLGDHRINGVAIVPMAALLELVTEAVAETTGREHIVLEDIVVQQPLVIPEDKGRTVQVILDTSAFRVFSLTESEWILHATGTATDIISEAISNADGGATDTSEESSAVASRPRDIREHYRHARSRGAQFGPAFQTIVALSVTDHTARARIRLSDTESSDAGHSSMGRLHAGHYQIHPAILDGSFQTTLAIAESDDTLWLPLAVDRFESFGVAGDQVESIVTITGPNTHGTAAADVRILNADGRLVTRVTGLRLKQMPDAAIDRTTQYRYRIAWHVAQRHTTGSETTGTTRDSMQSATLDGTDVTARDLEHTASNHAWLIIADGADLHGNVQTVAHALCDELEQRGHNCTIVTTADILGLEPGATSDLGKVAELLDGITYRGIIHVATHTHMVDEALRDGCHTTLALVQALTQRAGPPPALWFVTRHAQSVTDDDRCSGFAAAPLLGLARTIAVEYPDVACTTVDIGTPHDVTYLVAEILSGDREDQVALRNGTRYVPRLVHDTDQTSADAPRQLTIPVRGTIDNLTFAPLQRRAPRAGEVEVRVETAALNFRDVLNALDMYPGEAGPLGLEFAGRVERVGPDVTQWRPGDRVMGIAWGSFATYVVTPATLLTSIPHALVAVAAATLPNAFLTAHHCLIETAQLTANDRVLIHAGAGGVGMAAIQLAKDIGAEVFATAGSEEKREYLRSLGVTHVLDSRTTAFADQILEITNGRGVDVILNSLSGEFIDASFCALAPRGRFVEIGKQGVWTTEEVAALHKEIAYSVVDLGPVIDQTPERIGQQLDRIRELAEAGRITPLPTHVFAFDDAPAAFRYMAQARHIGRIVLQFATTIQPNATYLITGGLGDIGLQVARWLASKGATHLALLGRSAPSLSARKAVDALRAEGVTISLYAADVSHRDELARVFDQMASDMPPLRGIIHAAGVVDDGVLVQQTWDRFAKVLAPKVHGAWNLHELAQSITLDFFVLFSSVASVLGSPSQGAYAAGNAFLDALAARRHAEQLPAITINWGAWAGSGMAARVEQQGRTRVLDAIRPMSPTDCFACLDRILASNDRSHPARTQYMVANADWSAWRGYTPSILENLVQPATETAVQTAPAMQSGPTITEQLARTPQAGKRGVLINFIRHEARRVLGLADTHVIDERQPLLKLGLDSLMAVELRNRLASALDRSLPATLLFDHPTLAALADLLLGESQGVGQLQLRDTQANNTMLDDIATMSDEEAERLLELELGQTE
jgi:acyl transferase domain-containing protein